MPEPLAGADLLLILDPRAALRRLQELAVSRDVVRDRRGAEVPLRLEDVEAWHPGARGLRGLVVVASAVRGEEVFSRERHFVTESMTREPERIAIFCTASTFMAPSEARCVSDSSAESRRLAT